MFEILRYPHLLVAMIKSLDRPTLCILMRTSSSVKELVLPALYPPNLIDPITSTKSTTQVGIPCDCNLPSQPHSTATHLDAKAIQSFLSSPHLGLAQNVTITDPHLWEQYLSGLNTSLTPASRDWGATTTIHIGRTIGSLFRQVQLKNKGKVILWA